MLHQMVLLQASPNYRLSTSSVMNLLTCDDAGKYSLTSDLSLTEIPPYAILSHTWESDEVTFADIGSSRLKWQQKVDYQKIRFCAEQARRNGLHYFWVGTCCIDKSNAIELQTAINSMFRWYRDAERCYVYMADVSHASASNEQEIAPWRTPFQKSKWFSRGWTLQELIAPKVVEFYSKEGTFLGDKQSLEYVIRDITGIPPKALRGTPLSEFTVTERESWARNRQTKYEEDMAYSFLGIFSVFLPLIYGEGRDEAQRRLREEIQKAVKAIPRRILGHILALNMKDETSIRQSFVNVTKQIQQQGADAHLFSELGADDDPNKAVEAAKLWLSLPGNTRWLLVYDNYDEAKLSEAKSGEGIDICKFLPTAYQGAVIITTRLSLIDRGHVIRVKKLESMADSLEILASTSGRANLQKDPDAKRLLQELDGLPLALATAGAYLRRVSVKLADYLRHYETSWERLHKSTPSLGSYKDRTLCSTWQISYQQIEKQFPLAANLLRFWAYFDNQDLWFELIKAKNNGGPTWLRQLSDELVFNEAIGTLHDYGFVEPCAESLSACEPQGYSIHSCLHSWTKHALNEEQSASLDRLALECVASCVMQQLIDGAPNEDDASQAVRLERRLLSHAKISFARNQDRIEDSDQLILHALGQLYTSQDLPDDAENMYSLAVRGCERAYGPDNEAKKIYLEILKKPMRKSGLEPHLAMFAALDLGWLYHIRGQFRGAESMFRRALGGFEPWLGPNHKQTLVLVSRLGHLCMEQDRADKTEPLLARALRGYEETIGPAGFAQSREALEAVADMGMLRLSQGQQREARGYLRRAHDGYMSLLGADHARTRQTQTVLLGMAVCL
ncbi:hypothetical protein MY4038_002087 [Beauveria bassiana]